MDSNNKRWKNLSLFGFGLAFGAAFCMKWMEKDLWVNGEKFNIIGLELFYSRRTIINLMTGMDYHVKTILRYHLSFDFAFMAGIYPAIASLCMLAKEKLASSSWKKLFILLAALQTVAWVFDIIENCFLLKWIDQPLAVGHDIFFFHLVVTLKWSFALIAVLFALPFVLRKKRSL